MQDYEEELKKILQKITPNVDTYYGEFSSLNDIKIDHNKMPAIFVDFLRPLNIPCQSNSDRRNPITPKLKF